MNQPKTGNTNDSYDSQKSARLTNKHVLLAAIALVLIIALVLTLFLINRNSDHSSTIGMDTQPARSDQPSPKAEEPKPVQQPAATGTVITTGESEYGTMLFNDKKQAIYIWELEDSPKAECYGNCAEAWPPVLTNGKPQATGQVNGDLLGTTTRSDGSTQVTYNGHPLYYYANERPGEVKCHNITTHGGLWWVIQPNGNRAN